MRGGALHDQLYDQPERDFLTVDKVMGAGRHGQAIVHGVGCRQA